MLEKFTKRLVGNVKESVKKEVSESMDEFVPLLFTVASIAIMIFANQAPRPVGQSITINNYYFGKVK